MKIPGAQNGCAEVKIAGEQIQIFRAFMRVHRITRARIELPEQHGPSSLAVHREQLDPCARHRQLFPARRIIRSEKTETKRDGRSHARLSRSCRTRARGGFNALEHLVAQTGWRRCEWRRGGRE